MKYENFSYIYPPRPKNAVDPSNIPNWQNSGMVAQPKMNGSNSVIFIDDSKVITMNRHNQRLTNFRIDNSEITSLNNTNNWLVLNGEYLNKSKRDENGELFNHKLIIFDILVYDNKYLVGSSFQERIELLDKLFGTNESEKPYLYGISENVYRVKSYTENFKELFENLSEIDMIEGLVCKRKNSKLELALREDNNSKSQIKFRKKTKNYKF